MTAPALILYWHFHQPNYVDPITGRATMPWVRLHGIKDYWGMAAILREFPEVRCAFNFVPSLLDQLEACAAGTSTDDYEELARKPSGDWTAEERNRALDIFFHAHWDRMIRTHPRYGQLLDKRAPWKRSSGEAAGDFSPEELRDLAAWFTLAWYHPLAAQGDAGLRELCGKDRGFSEAEKLYVLERQRRLLSEIMPTYRALAERGQVELTTTPYYHPILPLLVNMECARTAMPGVPMPGHWKPVPDDAREQLRRAVESHERRFGRRPAGCWPSEGSVSPEVAELLAEAGFRWAATDEDILAYSLGRAMERAELYRPYRVGTGRHALAMVFRDRGLSDSIGFAYHGWADQEAAARDFVRRVVETRGELVTVILDGENAWEYYQLGGIPFLRALYGELTAAQRRGELRTVLPDEHLAGAGAPAGTGTSPGRAGRRLRNLWPGSWINHDFYIWAGHRDDQRAWDYVFRVRADLERFAAEKGANPVAVERAWKALYAAEGSDWFWWYGDDHNSGNDEAFDRLFRRHLSGVYQVLGKPEPDFLSQPILGRHGEMQATRPEGLLAVDVDGQAGESEWLNAGSYRTAAGAMDRSGLPLAVSVLFGVSADEFLFRVDFAEPRRAELDTSCRLRLSFSAPRGVVAEVRDLTARAPEPLLDGVPAGRAALDHVLELALPRSALGLAPGTECALWAELLRGDEILERMPDSEQLRFTVAG
jgi:alpha-amylase/alpha-mannosidase (GH57 family)